MARSTLTYIPGFSVKVYDVRRTDNAGHRTPSDGKSSPGLWPGELKLYLYGL